MYMSSSVRPCLPPSEKSNEIFIKIFKENYTEVMVMKVFCSDPELRVNVMKDIITSFHCRIHHDIIKERIGFAVWMIGEYSLSVSEIEDGLSVIKRSIGKLFFRPTPPNKDHHWFEECRQRVLGDMKIRTQIAIGLTKLIHKLEEVFVDATKLTSQRTEVVRLIASTWLLPKPVDLGPSTIEFYTGEIRRCMRSLGHRDDDLMRVLENSTAENLVSLLSKKLQGDRQREQCDHAIFEFEAMLLGSKNARFTPH